MEGLACASLPDYVGETGLGITVLTYILGIRRLILIDAQETSNVD